MEFQIVYFLNHLGQRTIIDNLTKIISSIPVIIVFWFLLMLIALIFDKKNGKWILVGTLLVVIFYYFLNDFIIKKSIIEPLFFRSRPYIAFPYQIIPRGTLFHDSSFPSGHMAATAAFTTFFVYFYRKWWPAGLIIVSAMAFARMHNGMHYPTDVLAGTILGLLYGILAVYIVNKIKIARSKKQGAKNA